MSPRVKQDLDLRWISTCNYGKFAEIWINPYIKLSYQYTPASFASLSDNIPLLLDNLFQLPLDPAPEIISYLLHPTSLILFLSRPISMLSSRFAESRKPLLLANLAASIFTQHHSTWEHVQLTPPYQPVVHKPTNDSRVWLKNRLMTSCWSVTSFSTQRTCHWQFEGLQCRFSGSDKQNRVSQCQWHFFSN